MSVGHGNLGWFRLSIMLGSEWNVVKHDILNDWVGGEVGRWIVDSNQNLSMYICFLHETSRIIHAFIYRDVALEEPKHINWRPRIYCVLHNRP